MLKIKEMKKSVALFLALIMMFSMFTGAYAKTISYDNFDFAGATTGSDGIGWAAIKGGTHGLNGWSVFSDITLPAYTHVKVVDNVLRLFSTGSAQYAGMQKSFDNTLEAGDDKLVIQFKLTSKDGELTGTQTNSRPVGNFFQLLNGNTVLFTLRMPAAYATNGSFGSLCQAASGQDTNNIFSSGVYNTTFWTNAGDKTYKFILNLSDYSYDLLLRENDSAAFFSICKKSGQAYNLNSNLVPNKVKLLNWTKTATVPVYTYIDDFRIYTIDNDKDASKPVVFDKYGVPKTTIMSTDVLSATVPVNNSTTAAKPAALIAALYNANGYFKDSKVVDFSMTQSSYDLITTSCTFPAAQSGDITRIFIWDGISEIKPYAENAQVITQ